MNGYLAPEGFEDALEQELTGIVARYDRLFMADGPLQKAKWVQNIWENPIQIAFQSISEAATKLRSLSKGLWAFYPYQSIRRGTLISEKLPYFSKKPLSFPCAIPKAPLGSWTLLDDHTLLASPSSSSPFPHGEIHFQESKIPPSRAYLKLWEIFTRIGLSPKEGELCLDLGASPGGWTWVLDQLGATVIAVDRSPLTGSFSPRVSFLQKDAFSMTPDPEVRWVFSDVACFPEKLYQWVKAWLDAGSKAHFICTLKFQGNAYDVIRDFSEIPESQLFHLFHNKHELTFVLLQKNPPFMQN